MKRSPLVEKETRNVSISVSREPTTRANGEALEIGDHWRSTVTGKTWTWNGSFWTSAAVLT